MSAPGGRLGVRWRGTDVGHIDEIESDMWYLSGRWIPGSSPETATFEALARALDPKAILANPTAGTRVELTPDENELTHALVLALAGASLSLRRVLRPEAVDWLLKNVR